MRLFQRPQLTKALSCSDNTCPAHHEPEGVKFIVMINVVIIISIIIITTTVITTIIITITIVLLLLLLLLLFSYYSCSHAELNTGVMLMRNTDWSRQFIGDVARLGRMHVNHWQLMDEVDA